QRFYEAYSRNPAPVVEEQIEGARRRVSQLQLKILQETGASMVCDISGVLPRFQRILPSSQLPPGLGRPSQPSKTCCCGGLERTGRPLIIGPEEDCDLGYFNNECDSLFQDLGKLKSRPAHLGVFLRYIFSQADPSPLLFYLCTEVCQQTAVKDSRGLGKDIWNIFLDRNAVRAGLGWEPAQESLSLQGISCK
ncbi:ARHGB factor, partial [Urocolius indicus]|nr:ARHGB factor [Urocolius indicus]